MPVIYADGLALLELSFVLITLMLLHSMKRSVGSAPFYVALGTLMVFAQLVNASGMRVSAGSAGLNFPLAPAVFFTPFMAALLMTYVVDGTLEAQRLIWALVLGAVGVYLYLAFITDRQLAVSGYELYPDMPAGFFQHLLFSSRIYMLASLLSILVQLLALPVMYQLLRNRNCRLGVATSGALILTQVVDAFFYELVTNYNWDSWWEELRQSYLARASAMVWVSLATTYYLKLRDIPTRAATGEARSPLDIVLAFVGGYGRAQELQAYVREWEGRYRMVVESTHDVILLIDQSGTILDANRAAVAHVGYSVEELHTLRIQRILRDRDREPVSWTALWNAIYAADAPVERHVIDDEFVFTGKDGEQLVIDTVMTPLTLRNARSVLLVARDVTARRKLESEREQLRSQLIHSQRMEAVGKLAGGIAHDFNNLLHAVQASLDMLERSLDDERKSRQLTRNISEATRRASALTGQLLGFAREGKYHVAEIDMTDLVERTRELFEPMLDARVDFRVVVHPDPMLVEGDFTQLQQVLLNLLLNAREALNDRTDAQLIVRVEPATEHTPGWATGDGEGTADYVAVRVRDNGCGMTEATRQRIFEPFYTTKDSQGTGMGLAMAYGCVQNHGGWLHVTSTAGAGSEFVMFLPRAS